MARANRKLGDNFMSNVHELYENGLSFHRQGDLDRGGGSAIGMFWRLILNMPGRGTFLA